MAPATGGGGWPLATTTTTPTTCLSAEDKPFRYLARAQFVPAAPRRDCQGPEAAGFRRGGVEVAWDRGGRVQRWAVDLCAVPKLAAPLAGADPGPAPTEAVEAGVRGGKRALAAARSSGLVVSSRARSAAKPRLLGGFSFEAIASWSRPRRLPGSASSSSFSHVDSLPRSVSCSAGGVGLPRLYQIRLPSFQNSVWQSVVKMVIPRHAD